MNTETLYTKEEIDKINDISVQIVNYSLYLKDTDWYYARKMETGEEVPVEVVAKRQKAREFIRNNE